MTESTIELLVRRQEQLLDGIKALRADLDDVRVILAAQAAAIQRLEQGAAAVMPEARAQQARQQQRHKRLRALIGRSGDGEKPS